MHGHMVEELVKGHQTDDWPMLTLGRWRVLIDRIFASVQLSILVSHVALASDCAIVLFCNEVSLRCAHVEGKSDTCEKQCVVGRFLPDVMMKGINAIQGHCGTAAFCPTGGKKQLHTGHSIHTPDFFTK